MNIFDSTVTSWLKIFGSIIFMLLCLSGYRYGLQIAAAGFMAFVIKFFDNSLASDEEFKRKNIDLGQIYIHGIVCGLASWISFFYLKMADKFMVIIYFTVVVFVISAIGEYLSHKNNMSTKNKDIKENLIPSSRVFLVLMPALMLIIMAFGPYIFILVSVAFAIIMFIRAKQHGIEFAW